MNTIKCAVKDCQEVFKTEEGISSTARFICKNHPRSAQLSAAGRTFDPVLDTQDASVHFQDGQFSRGFGRPVIPVLDAKGSIGDSSQRRVAAMPKAD